MKVFYFAFFWFVMGMIFALTMNNDTIEKVVRDHSNCVIENQVLKYENKALHRQLVCDVMREEF